MGSDMKAMDATHNFKIRGEDRRRQERRVRSVPENLRRADLERRKGSERRRQATRRAIMVVIQQP
jgi:hypothetical protein